MIAFHQCNLSVAGLLLAAGKSSRVGAGYHKLLSEFEGIPLVRRSALTLLGSTLSRVIVVTGHRKHEIEAALLGLPVVTLNNPNFQKGLGTSIACGFGYQDLSDSDGILIMLADMPIIEAKHLDQLLEAFRLSDGKAVVRGSDGKNPGHPVIIPKTLFGAMQRLDNEDGGKQALQKSGLEIKLVDIGTVATRDVDTAQAIISAGGLLRG
jgi:molybdenum cofactor cytidylyltransferase